MHFRRLLRLVERSVCTVFAVFLRLISQGVALLDSDFVLGFRLRKSDLRLTLVVRGVGIVRLLGHCIVIVVGDGIGHLLVGIRIGFLDVSACIGNVTLSFCLGLFHIARYFSRLLGFAASGHEKCCGYQRAQCLGTHT